MSRLTLTHLTFIGTTVDPASVEFSPHVTVVRGPSDTGKSFIVDAIDFMFGANSLKEIPERTGYSTALLGLELPDGQVVTLSRSVNGGNVGLFRADVRAGPLAAPDEILAAKHNPKAEGNLSRYLLGHIGLDGKRVRKNVRNETDSLSFRNLAHLCIVDETQMQAEIPPALTGNYVSRTKEVSVLKLLLEDEDDSSLVAVDSKQEQTRLGGAKIEVIDRLLAELEAQLSETPETGELREQLARLTLTIENHSRAIGDLTAERNQIAEELRGRQQDGATVRTEFGDVVALRGRFHLLLSQYESDLERLAMIGEAGNLLGYFQSGVCVFCGAEPEHQHYNQDCLGDNTSFAESVEVEALKTHDLREDLIATLEDLDVRANELRARADAARTQSEELQTRLRELDAEIQPQHGDLREMLGEQGEVEKSLALYEQVANLERMKFQVADEAKVETAAAATGLGFAALREFSAELARRLGEWGFPEAQTVRYDRSEQDIIAGDQLRSAHGKGVRAILHAAFTLALAQYCFDRDIPHPGFVVLDSPLVTYRPPDPDRSGPTDDDGLPEAVVGAFYHDIQQRFDGQVIVMENTDPPEPLNHEAFDVVFTKAPNVGRYGFFRHAPSTEPTTLSDYPE
jgi:predicted nuclease with TOPRIM domain